MYISLIKKLTLNSLKVYENFKNGWGFYSHINQFNEKKFYMDNIVLNQIFSGKNVSDQVRAFLSKHLDVYHFVFNMYNTFFKNNRRVKVKLYLPYILNSLNKYEAKDLFNIDLHPIEEKVKIISNLAVGKTFVYRDYHIILETKDAAKVIRDKNTFRDLINHYYNRYDKSSNKITQSKDLQDVALIIEKIYEFIKENYLNDYHLDDVIALAEKIGFNRCYFSLSVKMFLFYHSSSLVFDFKLFADTVTNIAMTENRFKYDNVKFFITLDKNMFYYRSLYGKSQFGEIKDEEINKLKKTLFGSKYFVKRRNKKIDIS